MSETLALGKLLGWNWKTWEKLIRTCIGGIALWVFGQKNIAREWSELFISGCSGITMFLKGGISDALSKEAVI